MKMQIIIESDTLPDTEIKELLEAQTSLRNSDVSLELRSEGIKYRGSLDPTVLVAIVGLTGPAISALISGILKIIEQRASHTIIIQLGDLRLEIPANTPLDKIDQYIEKIKLMLMDVKETKEEKKMKMILP